MVLGSKGWYLLGGSSQRIASGSPDHPHFFQPFFRPFGRGTMSDPYMEGVPRCPIRQHGYQPTVGWSSKYPTPHLRSRKVWKRDPSVVQPTRVAGIKLKATAAIFSVGPEKIPSVGRGNFRWTWKPEAKWGRPVTNDKNGVINGPELHLQGWKTCETLFDVQPFIGAP